MTPRTRHTEKTGLVVALDQPDLDQAEDLADKLSTERVAFKVGLTLFAAYGPEAIHRIGRHGKVFCDLKLHDIPQQVAGAAEKIGRLGVWMLSVHASGGASMIKGAAEALSRLPDPPLLAAVTVLTSLSSADLASVGQGAAAESQVIRLAILARRAGAGAIICSPRELKALRSAMGPEVLLVSPGVRPAGSARGDQSRTMTPAEAAAAGAGYLVVGRPITEAEDPAEAARSILDQLPGAAG